MEKQSTLSEERTQTLQRYHQLTSPIVPLQTVKQQDLLKDELRRNASTRLDCIKNRNSSNKIFSLSTTAPLPELKASAILYQIPQFSAPEVNFEVADQIRRKVEQVKNEVITHLPEINRSSNYAPKKLQHQLGHRSAVRELEEWLRTKLRNPPTAAEDTLEYKNMIMGVGMKELIRLISRRCNEEGRIAQQIWELTWGICRQIILYLSKRAHKCELLLDQELAMMRLTSEKEFNRLAQENNQLKEKLRQLEETHSETVVQLGKARRRGQTVEDQNKSLVFDNYHLQDQFRNVLEENLAIYLEIGDKNKRGWVKKMYKNIAKASAEQFDLIKLYKQNIASTIQSRNKAEGITGEVVDLLTKEEIEDIGTEVINAVKNKSRQSKIKRNKKLNKKNNYKQTEIQSKPAENDVDFITEPANDEEDFDDDYQQESQVQSSLQKSCIGLVHHLREEFKPIDCSSQTQQLIMVHAYASTPVIDAEEICVGVDYWQLNCLEQIGVNTEEIKDDPKFGKKKGKQNTKDEAKGRQKSKLYSGTPAAKDKAKLQKDPTKKSVLEVVEEQQKQKTSFKEANPSLSSAEQNNRQSVMSNSGESKSHKERWSTDKPADMNRSTQSPSRQNQQQMELDLLTSKKAYSEAKYSSMQSAFSKTSPLPSISTADIPQSHIQPRNLLELQVSHQNQLINRVEPTNLNDKSRPRDSAEDKQNSNYGDNLRDSSLGRDSYIINKPNSLHRDSNNDSSNRLSIPLESAKECTIQMSLERKVYLCAECNKLMNEGQQKYEQQQQQLRKNKMTSYSPYGRPSKVSQKILKRSNDHSPYNSLKKLALHPIESSIEQADNADLKQNRQFEKRGLRNNTRRSSYMNDLSYKKDLEGQLKNANINRDQAQDRQDRGDEQHNHILTKIHPHKLLLEQLLTANKQFIAAMGNSQSQTADSLDQYLQIVREINSLPESKVSMTEKAAVSIIEKNLFPILNQLLLVVRKAVKINKIPQSMRLFTSLPSIISNRINRKYGVKILAFKHLRVILMAVKAVGKYSDRYKTIELMMFTDCKSPHSEDLFIYLLLMGLFDPSFSSNRALSLEETFTVRHICEEHLSKQPQIYCELQGGKGEGMQLSDLVKSIITNYRLLKINRIEELGFVFLMLKKQHWMSYKDFLMFLSPFPLEHALKLTIAKQLLEYCDVRLRDQKIGITENMFSKFLTACDRLTLSLLERSLNSQLQQSSNADPQLVPQLVEKLYSTMLKIKTTNQIKGDQYAPTSMTGVQSSGDINEPLTANQTNAVQKYRSSVLQNRRVSQQLRGYSPLTYQICDYLERSEENKFLTPQQRLFIKRYLILHVLECELAKIVGIADYFSNSMLPLISAPLESFSLQHRPLQQPQIDKQ